MTGGVLQTIPGWALVCLTLATLTASGLLGVAVDRRLREHRRRRCPQALLRTGRLHLAAELHQAVSQEVSAVLLHAAGARKMPGAADPRVGMALELVTEASTRCMHELIRQRDVLQGLGAISPGPPLAPDLTLLPDLVRRARSRGVPVKVTGSDRPGGLDVSIGHTAYLVVSSWLDHADPAMGARAEIELAWSAHALELRVQITGDAPTGPPARAHTCLADRISLLGGQLEIRQLTRGQVATVTLPIRRRPILSQGVCDASTPATDPAH